MAYSAGTTPQWIKITKSYTDFGGPGLSADVEIYSLPAKGIIHATQIYAPVAFSGGTIASYTISVGPGGNLVKYAAAQSVFTGATIQQPSAVSGVESMTSSTAIWAQAVAVGGNLNTATVGSVDIYLLISKLP